MSTVGEALNAVVRDVAVELSYVRELADALFDAAPPDDPLKIEALASSMALMVDGITAKLDQHVQAAADAREVQ